MALEPSGLIIYSFCDVVIIQWYGGDETEFGAGIFYTSKNFHDDED